MTETVPHQSDDDQRCPGCGSQPVEDEIRLNTGVLCCEACTKRVAEVLARCVERASRYPTPELARSVLTQSDHKLSLERCQALERARDMVLWAAQLAERLGDPGVPDEALGFELEWVEKVWAAFEGRNAETMATYYAVTLILGAAAIGGSDASAAEAYDRFAAYWPDHGTMMDRQLFSKAVEASTKRADWPAISRAVDSARIGNWSPKNERDPESLRTEYQKWTSSSWKGKGARAAIAGMKAQKHDAGP